MLALTSCERLIDARATRGSHDADQAYFFAGEVADFGQTVSANDKTALSYLRALRRIDVCGLVDHDALAKIGEITTVSTFFDFNECDVNIKVPGATGRKIAAVEVVMTSHPGDVVAFRVGDTPVYQSYLGGCQYLLPLNLSRLPGAQPLHRPDQPFVRVELIGDADCAVPQRIANAVAERVTSAPLPPRDGAAVYLSALAERDPCEVLAALGEDVDHWDISGAQPHQCVFGIWRSGFAYSLPVQLLLQPQLVESSTQGRERTERDGVEIYLSKGFCSAISFVGPQMQRRVIGAGYIDVPNAVVRPAVIVQSGGKNCEPAADIAARAAKLYA